MKRKCWCGTLKVWHSRCAVKTIQQCTCRNNPKTIWLPELHELHHVVLTWFVGSYGWNFDYNVLFLLSSLLATNVLRAQHHVMGSLVGVIPTIQ